MFSFRKELELPPQFHWKFADEPELMAWTIRARDYNTFVADAVFSFMTTVIAGAALIMYSVYEGMSQPWRISSCVFFFFLILLVLLSVTHQRMNFAYR
jgi:membrane protein YdbS with pleckstrin-like domain